MDSEILYSLFGIIGFGVVIYIVLKGNNEKTSVKTKMQKKAEIIEQYKISLEESLLKFKDNKEARLNQKSILLKQYSDELSRNIFFDNDEIREIILELSTN